MLRDHGVVAVLVRVGSSGVHTRGLYNISMVDVPLHHITRAEYHRAIDAGIYENHERLELLDGLVCDRMTILPPHTTAVETLADWLRTVISRGQTVRSQQPIVIEPLSEPEPDLAVVLGARKDYARQHPVPGQTLLVVEVSDSSLGQDLGLKLEIYARAGIAVYWVVDLNGRRILEHRSPGGSGYAEITEFGETDFIRPPWDSDVSVQVRELLP